MNYCQECGSRREENSKVCKFCGYFFENIGNTSEKDKMIEKLKKKIEQLEKELQSKNQTDQSNNPWIFIMPIAFVAIFFLFVFMIIFITR